METFLVIYTPILFIFVFGYIVNISIHEDRVTEAKGFYKNKFKK